MSNQREPVIGEMFLQRGFGVPNGPVNQRIAWAQADVRSNSWCVVVGKTQDAEGADEIQFMTPVSSPGTPLRASVASFHEHWERP